MSKIKLVTPEGPDPSLHQIMDTRALRRAFLDVPYAARAPRRKLDLYLPDEGAGPFPLIVFIHGGAFLHGDKRDDQAMVIMDALEHGWAVASVGYTLAPEGVFPVPIFELKAAVRFLRARAGEYLLNPERFVAAGVSAGAYLALMLAATSGAAQFEDFSLGNGDTSSAVQGAMGFFGLYNLVRQSEFTENQPTPADFPRIPNFADIFIGARAPEHTNLVFFASPVNLVTAAMPPVLIQGGDADQLVPYQDSVELAEKITAVCGADRVQFDTLRAAVHGDPAYTSPENQARIFAFLEKIAH
jgi:acetyl esterase/lipase